MKAMWAGRFKKELNSDVNDFNSSISVDGQMFREDIEGSIAHAKMLAKCGILSEDDAETIVIGLQGICEDIQNGKLLIDPEAEDIHMFVESALTDRIGDVGKKLHTARSRNDQVATDTRLFLRKKIVDIKKLVVELCDVIVGIAEENKDAIMCGYTHMQKAQPVTLAHHLLAYASMLERDYSRLGDCMKRLNVSPLGSCALAGTTFPTDRDFSAKLLGFEGGASVNSMDGVSDRDFVCELCFCIAMIMMHLSRMSEEIILWSSWEFKYIELDDAYSTGSSIMPQKKNPDICELVRGKCGRAYGNLMAELTVMKGLPLAYNKDMQEDKEAVFDSVNTAADCLNMLIPMLKTAKFLKDNMLKAASKGFINATDVADYLAKKGVPFRTAYKISGQLVAYCIDNEKTLCSLSLDEYKKFDETFDEGVFDAVDLTNCVNRRNSKGGPSETSVSEQIGYFRKFISEARNG